MVARDVKIAYVGDGERLVLQLQGVLELHFTHVVRADLFPSSLLPQRSSLALQAHRIDPLDFFHAQPPP